MGHCIQTNIKMLYTIYTLAKEFNANLLRFKIKKDKGHFTEPIKAVFTTESTFCNEHVDTFFYNYLCYYTQHSI